MQQRRFPYLPALDGIRGLSVAAVLAFHDGSLSASGGFLGVSTFFTLSGFLITSLLLDEYQATGRIGLAEFWTRRFRRLMPAALLTLAGVALYGAWLADPQQLWRLRGDGLASLFYYANWQFVFSDRAYEELFGRPSPVQHFWSLSIEEQFYFVYPILFLGLCRWTGASLARLGGALAALAGASLALTAWLHAPEHTTTRVYYGTDTRAAELLIGALLALAPLRASSRERAGWPLTLAGFAGLGACLGLWATATPGAAWLYEGGLGGVALASAALIAAAVRPGPCARLLAFEPLRRLGVISYGVYLFHWPVYLCLDAKTTGLGPAALLGLRVSLSLALAALSYRWFELPIRSGRWPSRARLWQVAPAALALVAAALVGVTRDLVVPRTLQHPLLGGSPMPPLRGANGAELPRVIVFGDSVASTLGEGLERWGRHTRKAIVWNLASYGCGLTHGAGAIDRTGAQAGQGRCGRGAEWWRIQIDAFDPQVVLVMAGLWDLRDRRLPQWTRVRAPGDPIFDEWLLAEFEIAVDALSANGSRIVWLSYPCISPNPGAEIVLGPLGDTAALDPARLAHLNHVLLPELARRRPGRVEFVDLDARVCPGGAFQTRVEGVPGARPDGVHFSLQAADRLAMILGPLALHSPAPALAPTAAPAAAHAPAAEIPAPPPAPRVPAAAPAAKGSPPAPPLLPLPLEQLLRVPAGPVGSPLQPDLDEVLRRKMAGGEASEDDADAEASRLRLDVDVRSEEPVPHRDLKRDQIDAAAALDVGKDTSIKGGVRVERDSSGGVESHRKTTPTIGIEKRF